MPRKAQKQRWVSDNVFNISVSYPRGFVLSKEDRTEPRCARCVGWLLMQMIVDYAGAEGIRVIEGQVLRENTTMLNMCRELGFEIASDPEEADVQVVKLRL